MSVDSGKLTKDMAKILGKDNVFTDKPTVMVYAQDIMPYDLEEHNLPYAVVRPSSAEEISQVLKYANEKLIPVHIHGSGTSLSGLARPKTNCLLLDMGRMTQIKVFPERGYFEVGPGAHVAEVRAVLAKHKAMLPVFPGSELIATIGGIIAVNTSAHAVDAALGKPGDFVLGLEVVLPTGEVIETGTQSTRRPAGIELTRTFIGSEGLLGVLTMIRMRLIPAPFYEHIVAHFRATDDVLGTVMEMYQQKVPPPIFFEFLDEKAAKVGFQAVGLPEPEGAVAMINMHCWSKDGAAEKAKIFLEFLKTRSPIQARIVKDEDEWNKIWGSRAEAGNYIFRVGMTFGSEVTPRVDKLKEAYQEARSLILNLESYKNTEFYSFGHIGAPTIHAYALVTNRGIPNDTKKAIVMEVRERTEELNIKYGGCGGEWGVTAQRVSFLKKKYGEGYYGLLVRLKKTFDPNNILNRGNLEGWL